MLSLETWAEQITGFLRLLVPLCVIAALLLLNIVSISYPFVGAIKAPLFLMAVYYWAIYRPTLIPPWFVFACGILMDVTGGLPFGLNAAAYVGTHWLISEQRRFFMSQSFAMMWLGFMILSFGVAGLQWAVFCLLEGYMIPFTAFFYANAMGLALFPMVCLLLHLSHKVLPDPGPNLRLGSQG